MPKLCSEPGCPNFNCKRHDVTRTYNTPKYKRERRQLQIKYQGTPCPACGVPMTGKHKVSADHTPGKPNSPLRPLCLSCNSGKRGRTG